MPERPTIIEKEDDGRRRSFDVYARLLEERVVLAMKTVDDEMAADLIAQLLLLEARDPRRDIHFYLMSPGGAVGAGLGLYDVMKRLRCDVCTYGVGHAESMGAILLAAGTRQKRFILPHARVMIHQVLGGVRGTASDFAIEAKEITKIKEELNLILARETGQPIERVRQDTERNYYLSAAEAVAYGIVDKILEPGQHPGRAPREK